MAQNVTINCNITADFNPEQLKEIFSGLNFAKICETYELTQKPKADDIREDDIKEDDIKEDDIREDDIKEDDIKEDDIKEDDIKEDNIKEAKPIRVSKLEKREKPCNDESYFESVLRSKFRIPQIWDWQAENGKASPNFKPSEVAAFLLELKGDIRFKACRKSLLTWLNGKNWVAPKTSLMFAIRSIIENELEWPKGKARNGASWRDIMLKGQK